MVDTASNTLVGTPITVGSGPTGVAVTPDGKHAYVANNGSNNVSVIDTVTNTVVGTPIPVGNSPLGVAITPDGKHAYVANNGSNNVSVIDTATNTVVGTPIPVGDKPFGVGIVPPPTCISFLAISTKLELDLEHKPNKDRFELLSSFTLGTTSDGIKPVTEPVTLKIGTFTTTIPPSSFKEIGLGIFVFHGVIGGVRLEALIAPTGSKRYALVAAAQDANLTGTVNPVPVTLTIGDDCGTAPVTALIF